MQKQSYLSQKSMDRLGNIFVTHCYTINKKKRQLGNRKVGKGYCIR